MFTVVVSGPGGSRSQALAALASAGFAVITTPEIDHSHGLPDHTDGSTDPAVNFLSATGPNIDTASAVLEPLGWTLRSYWLTTTEA